MSVNSNVDSQKTWLSLIRTLENLLFSMPIPEDVVSKYNIVKEMCYRKLDIPFTSISKSLYSNIGAKATNSSIN